MKSKSTKGSYLLDLHGYESEQRRRIASRDWARIHVAGDKAPAITLPVNWRAPR